MKNKREYFFSVLDTDDGQVQAHFKMKPLQTKKDLLAKAARKFKNPKIKLLLNSDSKAYKAAPENEKI